ncbi:MAG: hypothetical protein D6815_03155 [Candidatus Dadabacteria bacterium]|nr:MAG: hypothetical protein D6815_03155 [Candidatus Dadabacteria bacterium]
MLIAADAVIGSRCSVSQEVTIGYGLRGERRGAPTLGDNVYVAPGAKLFGKIRVGDGAKIGANAVVFRDIPAGARVRSAIALVGPEGILLEANEPRACGDEACLELLCVAVGANSGCPIAKRRGEGPAAGSGGPALAH